MGSPTGTASLRVLELSDGAVLNLNILRLPADHFQAVRADGQIDDCRCFLRTRLSVDLDRRAGRFGRDAERSHHAIETQIDACLAWRLENPVSNAVAIRGCCQRVAPRRERQLTGGNAGKCRIIVHHDSSARWIAGKLYGLFRSRARWDGLRTLTRRTRLFRSFARLRFGAFLLFAVFALPGFGLLDGTWRQRRLAGRRLRGRWRRNRRLKF